MKSAFLQYTALTPQGSQKSFPPDKLKYFSLIFPRQSLKTQLSPENPLSFHKTSDFTSHHTCRMISQQLAEFTGILDLLKSNPIGYNNIIS